MIYVHKDNHAKIIFYLRQDLFIRSPVIQKPFQAKSDTSMVARAGPNGVTPILE